MGTSWFGLTTGSCSEPENKDERILLVLIIFKTGRKKKGVIKLKQVQQFCAKVCNLSEWAVWREQGLMLSPLLKQEFDEFPV